MSTRDVLKRSRPKVVPVEVSTGTVFVKGLSGAGRQKYSDMAKDGAVPLHKICALGLVDENGVAAYDLSSNEQMTELSDSDGADLQKIATALFEASGLGANSVSEAEKKSEGSQS